MKPIDSLAVFKQYARSNLVELDQCSLREGFDQMIQFFTNVKPVGCAASFGDALLFQWGIYNWDNKSDRFEINITRQFIEQDGIDDELEISQLELTFSFQPNPILKNVDPGNKWCETEAELPAFQKYIFDSIAFSLSSKIDTFEIDVKHGYV